MHLMDWLFIVVVCCGPFICMVIVTVFIHPPLKPTPRPPVKPEPRLSDAELANLLKDPAFFSSMMVDLELYMQWYRDHPEFHHLDTEILNARFEHYLDHGDTANTPK